MEDKYILPIATMLAGLAAWIAVLVWSIAIGGLSDWSPWLETGLCLLAGGLIAFSAFR